MSLYNAIVWLDHDQAHIFQFNAKEGQELVVRSRHRRDRMLHPNHRGKEQKADMTAYFKAIEEALNEVDHRRTADC